MKHPESDPWNAATFEGARAAQTREAASRTTAYERIRWACEMSEAIRERDELARQSGRNYEIHEIHE
jgi:hypothetical protein